jgi:hypothetical protein
MRRSFPVVLLALMIPLESAAQAPRPLNAAIDAARRKAAIDGLARSLRQEYVFPDVAKRAADAVRKKLASGGYTETRAREFAEALTRDLQAITKDRHLGVHFDPGFRMRTRNGQPGPEEQAAFRRMAARVGFGIEKVQRLPGNVGLLDLRGFMPKELSASALSAAMTLLAGTDALLIDIRQNTGGLPEGVAFLCTYFFPEGARVHLNDLYNRRQDTTQEYWTEASVPGTRYVGKPVYVLTSSRTFSAGEEFAYDLQTQKRATIVGETTGGGAHPGDMVPIGSGFVAFVPSARAINPITKKDWEGVGVKPDIAAAADKTLQVAHLAALRELLRSEKDPERRRTLEEIATRVEKGEPEPPPFP